MKQPKLPLPPVTQQMMEEGRASIMAAMTPEGRARCEAHYNNPDNFEALQWKSKTDPWRTEAQLAREKKKQEHPPR